MQWQNGRHSQREKCDLLHILVLCTSALCLALAFHKISHHFSIALIELDAEQKSHNSNANGQLSSAAGARKYACDTSYLGLNGRHDAKFIVIVRRRATGIFVGYFYHSRRNGGIRERQSMRVTERKERRWPCMH